MSTNHVLYSNLTNNYRRCYTAVAKTAISSVSAGTFFDIRAVFDTFNDIDFNGIGFIYCRNNSKTGIIRAFHSYGDNAVSPIEIETGKLYDLAFIALDA